MKNSLKWALLMPGLLIGAGQLDAACLGKAMSKNPTLVLGVFAAGAAAGTAVGGYLGYYLAQLSGRGSVDLETPAQRVLPASAEAAPKPIMVDAASDAYELKEDAVVQSRPSLVVEPADGGSDSDEMQLTEAESTQLARINLRLRVLTDRFPIQTYTICSLRLLMENAVAGDSHDLVGALQHLDTKNCEKSRIDQFFGKFNYEASISPKGRKFKIGVSYADIMLPKNQKMLVELIRQGLTIRSESFNMN